MTPALRTVGVAILLGSLSIPAIAQDKDKADKAFRDGIDARGEQKWTVVADNMRQAIAERSAESKEKVAGRIGRLLRGGNEYLPHYYLGEALFRMGDCLGAVDAWAESERQGVVKTARADFYKQIRDGYQSCEQKGVLSSDRFAAMQRDALKAVTESAALVADFDKQAQANLETWRAEAGLREQYDRIAKDMQTAREKLKAATQSRNSKDLGDAVSAAEGIRPALASLDSGFKAAVNTHAQGDKQRQELEGLVSQGEKLDRVIEGRRAELTITTSGTWLLGQVALKAARERLAGAGKATGSRVWDEARGYATEALSKFGSVINDLDAAVGKTTSDRRLRTVLQASQEAFSFADGSAAALDRRAAGRVEGLPADVASKRESLTQQLAAARRRYEAARKTSNVPELEAATRSAQAIRTDLDKLVASFGPPTLADRGVHPELLAAAKLYAAGNYKDTLTSLDRLPEEAPLQLHAHLFRAASLLALYHRSGAKDQSLQDRARSEVEKCKQLDPGFAPDTRMFPPRFIAFYRDPVPSSASAAGRP